MPNVSISRCAYASISQNVNLLRPFINIPQGRHYKSSKVQALFVTVIYEDRPLRKTEKRGPFRKIKTPLSGIKSFSNSTFYGAILSNTQYPTSVDLIYSKYTELLLYSVKIIACKRTWIFRHNLRPYRKSFS